MTNIQIYCESQTVMSFLKTLDTCIFGNGVVGVGVDLFVMFDDGM